MAEIETYLQRSSFSDLHAVDQKSTVELVAQGGAIEGTAKEIGLRLKRARQLALLRIKATNRIIGVAALKNPDSNYRAKTFNKACFPISCYENAPELGYVVVAEDMRGRRFSGCLVHAITADTQEPTFATTDDTAMQHNLQRSGFVKVGKEWQGNRGVLTLWLLNDVTP